MSRANYRGYDPVLAEDVWTIEGLFKVKLQGKLEIDVDWETAGQTGRPLSVILDTDVLLGGWANAIKGYVDCGDSGGSIGLISGVNGEVRLPNAAARGAYYGLESEIVFQASSTITPWGSSAGFLFMGAAGDGVADFDTDGVFMLVGGLTPGIGKLLSADMHTFKCTTVVDGTHNAKYLVMSIAENILSHSFTVIPTNGVIFKLYGDWATPGLPDGEGIVNIQANVTGVAVGHTSLTSAWINFGSASEFTGKYINLHTDGYWDGGADLAGAFICWARYSSMLASSDYQSNTLWSLNLAEDNDTLTALFETNDRSHMGYIAGGGTNFGTPTGTIPFLVTNGVDPLYILVYGTRG